MENVSVSQPGLLENAEFRTKVSSSFARINSFEHLGQLYWVKRKEYLSLSLRLRKGDSTKAYERERSNLHKLGNSGLPFARIVAEGPDFFVMQDYGKDLQFHLQNKIGSQEQRDEIFSAAGSALARIHSSHLCHGHPRIKDVCWKDGEVTFIDLERHRSDLNTQFGQARDVLMFFFSVLVETEEITSEITSARNAYLSSETVEIWKRAQQISRKLRFVNWLTKPVQWRRKGRANEFKAIPLTLEFFRQSTLL